MRNLNSMTKFLLSSFQFTSHHLTALVKQDVAIIPEEQNEEDPAALNVVVAVVEDLNELVSFKGHIKEIKLIIK